jgi:hypothetical protein
VIWTEDSRPEGREALLVREERFRAVCADFEDFDSGDGYICYRPPVLTCGLAKRGANEDEE